MCFPSYQCQDCKGRLFHIFYIGAKRLNSGPHASEAIALATELSPQALEPSLLNIVFAKFDCVELISTPATCNQEDQG